MLLTALLTASLLSSILAATCSTYQLINSRGTNEPQGPSIGFLSMNSQTLSSLPGGSIYNVVYPAEQNQDSSKGTQDIVRQVKASLASNPATCFVLEGYSQGARSVVDAMPLLTGPLFSAIKAVVLVGNPAHKAGLACNVDNYGGTTTRDVNGGSAVWGGRNTIPDSWVSKSLDICIKGDGVCDTKDGGMGITTQHLLYGFDSNTQNLGAHFIQGKLQGGSRKFKRM